MLVLESMEALMHQHGIPFLVCLYTWNSLYGYLRRTALHPSQSIVFRLIQMHTEGTVLVIVHFHAIGRIIVRRPDFIIYKFLKFVHMCQHLFFRQSGAVAYQRLRLLGHGSSNQKR